MGRVLRPSAALLLALFVRPAPGAGPATPVAPIEAAAEAGWYAPTVDDFRPHYDRDAANRRRQTWEQYWGWVESFYRGNFFTKGWAARAEWLVADVTSAAERDRLRARLNALGRSICAEWSKDYDVRKVSSSDLLTWGKMLEKARAENPGSGATLGRAIDRIEEHHLRKAGIAAVDSSR